MNNQIKIPGRHFGINHNVTFLVRDANSMKIRAIHRGHNAATNSMITGIAHYLTGDGILNQGWHLLSSYVPKYISLGTMGLGPTFANRADTSHTINCELISNTFPRVQISYREIVPEVEAEFPQTIDVIYSAMISVGALAQFREEDKDYLFITEAGLWSRQDWTDGGENGLLAGYRLAPSNRVNWGMTPDSITQDAIDDYIEKFGQPTEDRNIEEIVAEHNRNLLKQSILRVNSNQVVQVIWKIQIGAIEQLVDIDNIYSDGNIDIETKLYWEFF